MENENPNQQSEGGAWNDLTPQQDAHAAERQEQAAVSPQKNPETTPTAELVADYEALLAEIKVRKANHDDNLASLDGMRAEAVTAYEAHVKGASVEAAKLLVVISKRLGVPLNGLQAAESHSVSQQRRLAAQGVTFAGRAQALPGKTTCKVCGKTFSAGIGMHLKMHDRQKQAGIQPETAARAGQTRWCEKCGKAIHVNGWATHQAMHQRGKPGFSQSMSDEKCRELLVELRKYQPIGSREFSQRLNKPSLSAFMTGLKQRGYAHNDNHQWTVTPKGVAFIS